MTHINAVDNAGINAVNFAPFPRRGVLGSPAARDSLRLLAERTGASHVILCPAGLQATPQSETIDFTGPGTPGDEELAGAITLAQSLGLQVILKPTVNCANGVWRAYINFFDHDVPCEPQWGRWFASHEAFQIHYARLARETGCVLFIMGCEMVMAERRETEWRNLTAAVKAVFRGPVSYNTDKYQEDHVAWWDCVDVISSSGYYPSGTWDANLDRVGAVVARFGKPFFFAEMGCMSAAGSPARPNDWTLRGAVDTAGQAAWYAEMFDALRKRPWVGGVGLWSWSGELYDERDAAGDDRYELFGKPAERVVRENFTR